MNNFSNEFHRNRQMVCLTFGERAVGHEDKEKPTFSNGFCQLFDSGLMLVFLFLLKHIFDEDELELIVLFLMIESPFSWRIQVKNICIDASSESRKKIAWKRNCMRYHISNCVHWPLPSKKCASLYCYLYRRFVSYCFVFRRLSTWSVCVSAMCTVHWK